MIVRTTIHKIMEMTTNRAEAMIVAKTMEIRRPSGCADAHVL